MGLRIKSDGGVTPCKRILLQVRLLSVPLLLLMNISNRTKRYITKALEASLESDFQRIKIGAIVVDGNVTVGTACNKNRSHPRQSEYNRRSLRIAPRHCIHAEIHAIVRCGRRDLTGCEMYVARYDRTGRLGNCYPCPACRMAIKESGIRSVHYTTPEGIKSYEVV